MEQEVAILLWNIGILGVRMESSIEEIRRAYRKLAMVSSASVALDFGLRNCFG